MTTPKLPNPRPSATRRLRVHRESFYVGSVEARVGLMTQYGAITRVGNGVFWTAKPSLYVHNGYLFTEGSVDYTVGDVEPSKRDGGLYTESLAGFVKQVQQHGFRPVCTSFRITVGFGRDLIARAVKAGLAQDIPTK